MYKLSIFCLCDFFFLSLVAVKLSIGISSHLLPWTSSKFPPLIISSSIEMAENGLVSLATMLRDLLATPNALVPESKEQQNARLDIIDMIPNLSRKLLGDEQTLRELAWSVSDPFRGNLLQVLTYCSTYTSSACMQFIATRSRASYPPTRQ